MDGQSALIGGGVLVGGVYAGGGMVSLADRLRDRGHAKLWSDLEARGSMGGDEFHSLVSRYDRTVKAPTNLLRNAGVVVALGSMVIGGVTVGTALLGGD